MSGTPKRIQNLYDARSRYIHGGELPEDDDLRTAEAICQRVLRSLRSTSSRDDMPSLEEWPSRIDFVCAAIRADRDLGEDEFRAIGILGYEVSEAPNRVKGSWER